MTNTFITVTKRGGDEVVINAAKIGFIENVDNYAKITLCWTNQFGVNEPLVVSETKEEILALIATA